MSKLFETNAEQDGTGDVIALNTGQTTLTALATSSLLGFAVKLLNLPAQATHVLGGLGRVLSHSVDGDIVRVLGRKHEPEPFHRMAFGKVLDMERLALLGFIK
ncbi:MAG: hypothetical protein ABI947_24950 [Chloroflexota bacterium]